MIESAIIENFRGFRQLRLPGLRRINVIVGDNGSGKTALLEALFLASASTPEVALRLRDWRGLSVSASGLSPREVSESLWADLFPMRDPNRTVSIVLKGTAGDSRSLQISKVQPSTVLPIGLQQQEHGTYSSQATATQSPSGKFS